MPPAKGGGMEIKMEQLQFYCVDMKYVRNLKSVERQQTGRANTIFSVFSQTHKQGSHFVGYYKNDKWL